MDDEIIYSWRFNLVKCFDSTPSAAIIVWSIFYRAFRASDCVMEGLGFLLFLFIYLFGN